MSRIISEKDIRQLVQELADKQQECYSKLCTVNSVDKDALTCDVAPWDNTADILKVALQADAPGKGFYMVPVVGSTVIVDFQNEANAVVILTSEIEDVVFVNDGNFKVQSDGNVDISCNGDVNIDAKGNLKANASGNLDFECGGQITLKNNLGSLKDIVKQLIQTCSDLATAINGIASGAAQTVTAKDIPQLINLNESILK